MVRRLNGKVGELDPSGNDGRAALNLEVTKPLPTACSRESSPARTALSAPSPSTSLFTFDHWVEEIEEQELATGT